MGCLEHYSIRSLRDSSARQGGEGEEAG
jgi:hypothetical protein